MNSLENKQTENENLKKFIQKKNENPTQKIHTKIKTFYHNINFDNGGDRTIFTIFSKIPTQEVEQNKVCNFPNAEYNVKINGLYIFEDFISEEEEKDLINNLDKNKWEKLTNRKVQHYGYEFIYGPNIINKENKIGGMPEFCSEIMKRNYLIKIIFFFSGFEEKLRKFKVKVLNNEEIQKNKEDLEKIKDCYNYIYDENNSLSINSINLT